MNWCKHAILLKLRRVLTKLPKQALRKNAQIVILAEDVNPPELVHHIPLICDDAGIPYAYVPSQEFLAKEANLPGGVKAATIALMDINKGAKELFDEVVELVGNLKA